MKHGVVRSGGGMEMKMVFPATVKDVEAQKWWSRFWGDELWVCFCDGGAWRRMLAGCVVLERFY